MLTILIPVDGSEPSLEAVRHSLRLVREGLQAEFVLANVQQPASLYEMVMARDPEVLQGVSAGAGAHLLAAAEGLCLAAGVGYQLEVASGDPAPTLLEIVERYGCDAVIMGADTQGAISSALLGSVAHDVMQACPVPVTVVRPAPPAEPAEDDVAEDSEASA